MVSLNFDPFPVLLTERLVLRQITEDDIDAFFALRSDKNVMKFIARPLAASKSDVIRLIGIMEDALSKKEGITWAITTKSDDKLVGTIGYWRIVKENYRAEIGYLLHYDLHGRGIMQEALDSVLNYGFKEMKLNSVEAVVNPGNTASINLLQRNGFIREGYFKEYLYFEEQFLDTAVYSLLGNKDKK